MPTYVYLVTGPTGKRYVGVTRVSIKARWAQHVRNTRHSHWKSALSDAIAKYGADNFLVEQIAVFDSWDEALSAESGFIKALGTFGPKGYNLTAGGEGRLETVASDETRQKMSRSRTGRKASDSHVESLRRAHRNKSDEQRAALAAKISAANARRSDAERARISEAIAASKRGKPRSAECVEKMRAAKKGRKLTPDQIESLRAANTGRRHTPETILRMTALARERREATAAAMREVWRKRREAKTSG